MPRPAFRFSLYPSQGAALRTSARETLLAGPRSSGASHLLRVLAIIRAAHAKGPASIVLAARDAAALERDHMDGPGGVWALLAAHRDAGEISYELGNRVKFAHNEAEIRFTTWRKTLAMPDLSHLFLDDADDLDAGLFRSLRERVFSTGRGGGANGAGTGRLVVVAHDAASGWPGEHWRSLNESGARIDLDPSDLPAHLRREARILRVEPADRPVPPDLFPSQCHALAVHARELLVRKEPSSGASYLLRRMAVERAAAGASVLLVAPDDRALRVDHLDDHGRRTSLWRMVAGEPVTMPPGEVRWAGGGSVRVATWDTAVRKTAAGLDMVLLDEADGMPAPLFHRLRDRVLQAPERPGDEGKPRLVAVSARPTEGWLPEHFRANAETAGAVDLHAAEMPEPLRAGAVHAPIALPGFEDFAHRVCPTLGRDPHIRDWLELGQRVLDGDIRRLIVMAPGRVKKSLVFSRLLPACFLRHRPAEWASVLSATGKLPLIFSEDAQTFFVSDGGSVRPGTRGKPTWRTTKGGGFWARGIDEAYFGFGFGLGVVDDPFGTYEEGCNENRQKHVYSEIEGTFFSRQDLYGVNPAAIVVVMHRLHADDAIGRILDKEREEPSLIPWHVADFPPIARARKMPLPPQCTVVEPRGPDGQPLAPGELVYPGLPGKSREALEAAQRANSIKYAAMEDQEPLEDVGGGMFQDWWYRIKGVREMHDSALAAGVALSDLIRGLESVGVLPKLVREVRGWDFAATEEGGDATASTRGGITLGGDVIWTDASEVHVGAEAVEDHILEQVKQDGPRVDQLLPREPAAAGKILVERLARKIRRLGNFCAIVPMTVEGKPVSKNLRARPHAGAARCPEEGPNAGRFGTVWLLAGGWNANFLAQHKRFDGVRKPMDIVDAASITFSELDSGARMGSTVGGS